MVRWDPNEKRGGGVRAYQTLNGNEAAKHLGTAKSLRWMKLKKLLSEWQL